MNWLTLFLFVLVVILGVMVWKGWTWERIIGFVVAAAALVMAGDINGVLAMLGLVS